MLPCLSVSLAVDYYSSSIWLGGGIFCENQIFEASLPKVSKYHNMILMKLTWGANPNSIDFRVVYHLATHSEFRESSRSGGTQGWNMIIITSMGSSVDCSTPYFSIALYRTDSTTSLIMTGRTPSTTARVLR